MEPRKSENAFKPLREAAVSDSILTHPALTSFPEFVIESLKTKD